MQKGYFNSDSYNTPDKKRSILYRMLHYNRLYFTLKYAVIVFRTRRQAIKGFYDIKAWADSSFYILKFIEKAGGMFHISGMENISKGPGPVVFICNHMGTRDNGSPGNNCPSS